MASRPNLLILAVQGLRGSALKALENVAAFFLSLFGLYMVVFAIKWVAEQLDRNVAPTAALVFIGIAALVWLGCLSLVTPASVRGGDGKIRGGFVAGFVAAAAMVWVYIFAFFTYLLFKLGAVSLEITVHPDEPLSDLLDSYSWYLLDLIPGLQINEALGWKVDVDLNGGFPGVILLAFRLVIVFQIFALARKLLKASGDGAGGAE